MLYSPKLKRKYRKGLSAIVHDDDTSRIQTVSPSDNSFIYQLLATFREITGYPILANTSFNLKNETIVETIGQAISSFDKSPIHGLVAPPYLILKKVGPGNPLEASQLRFISRQEVLSKQV
jgi:carbamoyltransferase